jgi:hypothetical protein
MALTYICTAYDTVKGKCNAFAWVDVQPTTVGTEDLQNIIILCSFSFLVAIGFFAGVLLVKILPY